MCGGGASINIPSLNGNPSGFVEEICAFHESDWGVVLWPDMLYTYSLTGSVITFFPTPYASLTDRIATSGMTLCALTDTTMIVQLETGFGPSTQSGLGVVTRSGNALSITGLQCSLGVNGRQFIIRIDDTHFMRGYFDSIDICEVTGTTITVLNTTSVPPSLRPGSGIDTHPCMLLGLLDSTHAVAADSANFGPIGSGFGNMCQWALEFNVATGITAVLGPFQEPTGKVDDRCSVQRAGGAGLCTAETATNRALMPWTWDGSSITYGSVFDLGIDLGHSIGIAGGTQSTFGGEVGGTNPDVWVFHHDNNTSSTPLSLMRVNQSGLILTKECDAILTSTDSESNFFEEPPTLHSTTGVAFYFDPDFGGGGFDGGSLVASGGTTGWYLNTIAMAA